MRGEFKLNSADTYSSIPDRLILAELQATSILFIKQATDKRKLWQSANIFTVLPCVKMIQVPLAECCSFTSDCTIARSAIKLPKIAEGTNFGMLVQGLYSIDTVSRRFIESTPDRYVNSLGLGLKTNQIHWFIWEGYLYIGDTTIERIKISAYFEEDIPEDFISYPTYCGKQLSKGCCPASNETASVGDRALCCPQNPYDAPWKVPSYMEDSIVKEVANKLLGTYKKSQEGIAMPGRDTTK